MLAKIPQVAFRAQAYVTAREADAKDSNGATTANPYTDFQSPYRIKIMAPPPYPTTSATIFTLYLPKKAGMEKSSSKMPGSHTMILERSVGRENRVQVIGLIGVMKKFAFTWLVTVSGLFTRGTVATSVLTAADIALRSVLPQNNFLRTAKLAVIFCLTVRKRLLTQHHFCC